MATRLKSKAYRHIRDGLLSGRWSDGAYLSMGKIAKTIGMSHIPVREAVSQLENEGLLETIPKVGVRLRKLSRKELEQIYQSRIILESGAAKLAARMISPQTLRDLRNNLRSHLRQVKVARSIERQIAEDPLERHQKRLLAPVGQEIFRLNTVFHTTIIQATENPHLTKAIEDLHIITQTLQKVLYFPGVKAFVRHLIQDFEHHYAIHRAMERRDGFAAWQQMEEHITNTMAFHLEAYDFIRDYLWDGAGVVDDSPQNAGFGGGESRP
ncbi:MAG: GntR family transcriptional regulator [Phycisphaerae bacterium]|nr:GntR family transcriptional regulator [Phycisphaerae bacterium]